MVRVCSQGEIKIASSSPGRCPLRRRAGNNAKMAYEWHGSPGTTIIIIAVACCFGWIPIVVLVSIVGALRRRYGRQKDNQDDKPVGWHPKQPKLEIPNPIYHSTGGSLERTLSARTFNSESSYDLKRWESHSSWDPIKPFEYDDGESIYRGAPGGVARPNSIRSNYTARSRIVTASTPATPGRASSIRSVASHRSHQGPPGSHLAHAPPLPQQQSRTSSRRGSVSNNHDGPPVTFQINDAYYDTTPLPAMPSTPKLAMHIREPTSNSRPTSSRGSGSGSGSGPAAQGRRGTSREKPSDVPRDWGHRGHRGHRESPKPATAKAGQEDSLRGRRSKQSISGRRGSLHAQTFDTPVVDWFNQPHAM
ncbi:hypothetical protein QBC44DRAFT_403354 [Cladorrhinum sp. PSN332]|nr:hypothetical protein QBC44DRAFT_403354 [Cladorrhinum sp. PSN332]